MYQLPQISGEEFDLWLRHFLGKNYNAEADILFIDLFQDGSRFSFYHTLSERVGEYIATCPRKRKLVLSTIDYLLEFLVEKNVFNEYQSKIERRKIIKKIQRTQ
jgi:hypothetical protein